MQEALRPNLRPDFRARQTRSGDPRAPDRLVAHYVLERALSDRLRDAVREARPIVYSKVYEELFTLLPDHPQRLANGDPQLRVALQLALIRRHLQPHSTFLELGCGDAALSRAASSYVNMSYGLDVTDTLIDPKTGPNNFTFLRTEGIIIPLRDECVDFAYSYQLMEHLHPDDAAEQLREICRVLRRGGRYLCITPSRVTGPHDISRYFDYEATCLHLREYDYKRLRSLFHAAGFRHFSCLAWVRGRQATLPYAAIRILEASFLALPTPIRTRLTEFGAAQALLGLNAIAVK